jgi:hypothetical protein
MVQDPPAIEATALDMFIWRPVLAFKAHNAKNSHVAEYSIDFLDLNLNFG